MNKIYALLLALTISACVPDANSPVTNKSDIGDASCKVKAVNDPELGRVFYAPEHRLYKHVTNIDHRYCTESAARSAGYSVAPNRFADNAADYVDCLNSEGDSGSCHNYASGIYQSLKIYDRVCGPDNVQKAALADAVKSYVAKNESRLDEGRYTVIVNALTSKYSCGGGRKKK